MAVVQVNLGDSVSSTQKTVFGDKSHRFFTGWMLFCHPTNSVTALKEPQVNRSQQEKSPTGKVNHYGF